MLVEGCSAMFPGSKNVEVRVYWALKNGQKPPNLKNVPNLKCVGILEPGANVCIGRCIFIYILAGRLVLSVFSNHV
jgi:hypothetical protein